MGQKVSPHGLRVGIIKTWSSRWFAKEEIANNLYEDYRIRKFLKSKLSSAGVPRIEIERDSSKIKVHIHCSKPGIVIGKGGTEIEKLKALCEKMFGKVIFINIIEVKSPEVNAQLISESIAAQLEKRASFRRAMKQAISRAMRSGAKGVKVRVAGRLNGAEIARAEHYHEGTIPLQTLRADIDYGFSEANTTYGKIGVKVWLYKGEVFRRSFKSRSEAGASLGTVSYANVNAKNSGESSSFSNRRQNSAKNASFRNRKGGNAANVNAEKN